MGERVLIRILDVAIAAEYRWVWEMWVHSIIELLHRLWPHNQRQYGNVISGAYFQFWLGEKKKEQKKSYNQSGKQLMREKSSAETLVAALKSYCMGPEGR